MIDNLCTEVSKSVSLPSFPMHTPILASERALCTLLDVPITQLLFARVLLCSKEALLSSTFGHVCTIYSPFPSFATIVLAL